MALPTIKLLLGRLQGKAKTSPSGTFAAQVDWTSLMGLWGRPTDYDELYKVVKQEPTIRMCVYMPATDAAQVTQRVYRRINSNDTIAEQIGLRKRRKLATRWSETGSRSIKAKIAQIGEEIEEVTDPTDPVVRLIQNPNPRQPAFVYNRQLIANWRIAGGVPEAIIMSGGMPVQLEMLPAKYLRTELDRTHQELIDQYVAHRNGRDTEVYSRDDLLIYGTLDPEDPTRFVSAFQSCMNDVYLLWAMTTALTAMMANGGQPGGIIESTKGLNDTQRRQLEAEFMKRFAGPENAGFPLVLEPGLIYKETAKGRELDWNATIDAKRKIVMEAMGVPTELMDTATANLAGSSLADPKYARRTILPILRELEDVRNENLIPKFGPGFEDYFIACDDVLGEDEEALARVRQIKAQTYMTVNEIRAEDGLEPIEGGDVVLGLQQAAAPADPFAGLFGKQLEEIQAAVKALAPAAQPDEDIEITVVSNPKQLPATDSNRAKPDTITDIDAIFMGVEIPGCHCEGCRPPRKSKEADIDNETIYREHAAEVARRTEEWATDTYIDAIEQIQQGPMGTLSIAAFVEAAANRFLEDVSEPLVDTFVAGYRDVADGDESLGQFAVTSDRAAELYRQHRIGLSRTIAATTLEQSQAMVDAVIEQGFDEGRRSDEISKLLAEKVPGLSRSRAETIARTEVSEALQKGRLEAWEDSEFIQGKRYLLSSDPCFICEYTARKWSGKVAGIREPFLEAGETIPNPAGGAYVVTRDVLTANCHPRCRCSMAQVDIDEGDE